MLQTLSAHVRLNERGVAWIDETNTKVIAVVLDTIAHGWSPEAVHFQHRYLSLGQIHAALSYFHDHHDEFQAEIQERLRRVEAARSLSEGQQPTRAELRGWQLANQIHAKMRTHTWLVFLALVLGSNSAYACSCRDSGTTVLQDLGAADAVFVGRVTSVAPSRDASAWDSRRAELRVRKAWKGATGEIIRINSGLGGGDCGMGFEAGREYLVFAYRDDRDGQLHTDSCTRSKQLKHAGVDVRALGEPAYRGSLDHEESAWLMARLGILLTAVLAILALLFLKRPKPRAVVD